MIEIAAVVVAAATADGSDKVEWYHVLGGILLLPTLLIGIPSSYYVVKKTRLEALKLERELAAEPAQGSQPELSESVARTGQPAIARAVIARRVQDILLRAILMFLVLKAWDLLRELLDPVLVGARFGVGAAFSSFEVGSGPNAGEVIAVIALKLLAVAPTVAYWLIFISMGLPLVVDTLRALSIEPPPLLVRSSARRILVGIVILGLLATTLYRAG
ncbi:hypothetical protein [Kribbella voronezhensis]|nr:hypothetical protein [Kribbella voronezhensis]